MCFTAGKGDRNK